jgi:hypothetical protein
MEERLNRLIELMEENNQLLRESNSLALAIARPFLWFLRLGKREVSNGRD